MDHAETAIDDAHPALLYLAAAREPAIPGRPADIQDDRTDTSLRFPRPRPVA